MRIVVMRHRAQSPAAARVTLLATLDALTQMEFQKEDTALRVSGCREHLGPLAEPGTHGLVGCRRCAVVKGLVFLREGAAGAGQEIAKHQR